MFILRRHPASSYESTHRASRLARPNKRQWLAARLQLLLAFGAALLAACSTLPPATSLDRPITHALADPQTTPLGQALVPLEAAHPGQSGFRLLTRGTDALQMRIALARSATKTLDLQYYVAEEDTTGTLLIAAALYAADRGVRVRMLVDDLNFHDSKRLLSALARHPSIEVRIFNPFGGTPRSSLFRRTEDWLARVERFTHRMHNKAMIADGEVAIVGGRNLGDEYFSASQSLRFRDLDVLAAGPIVKDVSASFDTFWNSSVAYPISALDPHRYTEEDVQAAREALRAHWREAANAVSAKPLDADPLSTQITREALGLVWAPAYFSVDSPRKAITTDGTYQSPPMQRLAELMRHAQHEVLILSPYFVPHDAGVRMLGELTRRGVRVVVVTNSMASTDAIAVQAGYSPYRAALLQNGVELYEFQPSPGNARNYFTGSYSASLHAKTYVIDRRTLVIGSLNFDPRSTHLNTELAVFIESPQLASEVASLMDQVMAPDRSFRVRLATPAENAHLHSISAPISGLVWTGDMAGENGPYLHTWTLDPEAGFMRNLLTGLFLLLPVDSQL